MTKTKIIDRTIKGKDLRTISMRELMLELTKSDESAIKEFLSPEKRPDGRYVTSEARGCLQFTLATT